MNQLRLYDRKHASIPHFSDLDNFLSIIRALKKDHPYKVKNCHKEPGVFVKKRIKKPFNTMRG
jgi:hypothetical protein